MKAERRQLNGKSSIYEEINKTSEYYGCEMIYDGFDGAPHFFQKNKTSKV